MIVNFPPPARERLRLRWEDIEARSIAPRLLLAHRYGETGPDCDRPGFDITAYFGRSGILDAARYEGGPPGLSLPAQGDRATAMTLVAPSCWGCGGVTRPAKGAGSAPRSTANGAWSNGTTVAGAAIGAKLLPRQAPEQAAQTR